MRVSQSQQQPTLQEKQQRDPFPSRYMQAPWCLSLLSIQSWSVQQLFSDLHAKEGWAAAFIFLQGSCRCELRQPRFRITGSLNPLPLGDRHPTETYIDEGCQNFYVSYCDAHMYASSSPEKLDLFSECDLNGVVNVSKSQSFRRRCTAFG